MTYAQKHWSRWQFVLTFLVRAEAESERCGHEPAQPRRSSPLCRLGELSEIFGTIVMSPLNAVSPQLCYPEDARAS